MDALRGLDRICLERGGHIHEIQRVQMIEMHHMVMQVLHAQHQIADGRGVSGDFHADGVFKGAGGGKGVGVGAYAAGALREMLRVTRVTALENHFQPAEQCGGAASVLDAAVFHFHLDTQMSFDAGDGIHHNGSRVGALGSLCLTHVCSLVFKNMFHSRPVRRMTPRPTDRGGVRSVPQLTGGTAGRDFIGFAVLPAGPFSLKKEVSKPQGTSDEANGQILSFHRTESCCPRSRLRCIRCRDAPRPRASWRRC